MSALVIVLVMASQPFAPCAAAPTGMVCIPGGEAVVGADDQTPEERPRRTVVVPTFYLDTHEVTVGAYTTCERLGACPKAPRPAYYAKFQTAAQPLVPTTWEMAHAYCTFVGKRLPSEAEWEKGARGGVEGRTFPWGEDAPTCARTHAKGCAPSVTLAPGSLAPGAYGLFDMAGNGYEWVKDWWSPCVDGCPGACGAACTDVDPRGPCGGGPRCPGHTKRVLKGGSWYWPGELGRGSFRRGENPRSGLHRLSFRCASDTPVLSSWPPAALVEPRAPLADPAPPTAEELAKFRAVVEDTDVLAIPLCRHQGQARVDCRDPMSYIRSNEALQHLWGDAIANLGGGYLGLGADQSYSFIAHAKSRWAWLFDYDPTVVRLHHVVQAVVRAKETRDAFVLAFTDKERTATRALLVDALAALDEDERAATLAVFDGARRKLWSEYARQLKKQTWRGGFGWLQTDESYRYVRLLVEQGRILAIKGNLLTDKALPSIAASARALGVPIRVYYPSNAEEQWKTLPPQYVANVKALPFDDDSVVLRTLVTRQFHTASSKWHYLVHGGRHLQRFIGAPGYENVWRFMEHRQRPGAFLPVGPDGIDPRKKRGLPPDYLSYIGVKGG